MADKRPIGIFDSGIGGLTVLQELQAILPYEDFIYFADTLNLPYGNKTPAQILDYSRRIVQWMQDVMNVKLAVAACHTSSALALDTLSSEFNLPLTGTLHPLARTVLDDFPFSKIGILATPVSVESQVHKKILENSGFKGEVRLIACPDFVPLIEEGHLCDPAISAKASIYLKPFKLLDLNTLVFGCTHYPFIKQVIETILPENVVYIDPAHSIAREVYEQITLAGQQNNTDKEGKVQFYCSGNPEHLMQKIIKISSFPVSSVIQENLDDFYSLKFAVNQ
jgi:glutamate racemase